MKVRVLNCGHMVEVYDGAAECGCCGFEMVDDIWLDAKPVVQPAAS
jgi:hypothetical protein